MKAGVLVKVGLLISNEEEQLILLDRSAKRAAELVVPQRRVEWLARRCSCLPAVGRIPWVRICRYIVVKVVVGIQFVVADEIPCAPVPSVGTPCSQGS